ncbi:MAG UNVERIFIED_CONTAM: hypothetical protein LVR29_34695 [Microcystis novacekii LVE1205-3]|jgi:hypothetical protein
MKPVVKDPAISIGQLVPEVATAATSEARTAARDALTTKLRRLERGKKFDADTFATHAGGLSPTTLANHLATGDAAAAAAWFAAHPSLASFCDRQGSTSGRPLLISEHSDHVTKVEQGYGTDSTGKAIRQATGLPRRLQGLD